MRKVLFIISLSLFLEPSLGNAQSVNKTDLANTRDSIFAPPWSNRSGIGTGVGASLTDFEGNLTLNINLRIPLSTYFAVNVRPFIIPQATSDSNTTSAGGRIEFTARSKIMYNVIRAYASAGPQVFWGLSGTFKGQFDWSGGWVFGVEVFFFSRGSLYFEMGTSGGTVGSIGAGKTLATGFLFYPFKNKSKK